MAETTPLTFFSYSRDDSAFVLKVASDLRAAGADIWLDQLDIQPGEHWDSAVENALTRATRIVVVLSPSSVASQNVMDEVSFALDENRTVIPIIHRECKIPFRLRRLQYVDFTAGYDSALAELIGVLGGKTALRHNPPAAEEPPAVEETAATEPKSWLRQVLLLDPRRTMFARLARAGFYGMLVLTALFVMGVFLDEHSNFNLRAPLRDLGTNLGAFALVLAATAGCWFLAHRANSRQDSSGDSAGDQQRRAAAGHRG